MTCCRQGQRPPVWNFKMICFKRATANKIPAAFLAASMPFTAFAEPPDIEYIYPAGAQRGTTVPVRIGGYYFHGQANFEMLGDGVQFQPIIKRTHTIWFEGPLIHQPLSQRSEDYPKDHLNTFIVAKDAALGERLWRCWTSQGVTKTLKFVIGDFPEVMETEIDGRPIPQKITLPVTANGRIFPREDVDVWTFAAKAGETIVCDAAAKRFGSPLNIVLAVRDEKNNPVATNKTLRGGDPIHWFKAPRDGRYAVHIRDAKFWGLQNHVYRLTLKRGPHILSQFPLGAQRGTAIEAELNGPALPSQRSVVSFETVSANSHIAAIKHWGTARFVVSDFPEQLEPKKSTATAPIIFNGRIAKPGETDEWKINLRENRKITLDLAAAKLGSPLDAVLTLYDSEGRQMATNDDRAKDNPDPRIEFSSKKAGEFTLKIRDRFNSRGGLDFAYRLTATETETPGFSITLPALFYNVTRDPKGGLETNEEEIATLEKRIFQIATELKAAQTVRKSDPKAAMRIRELSSESRIAQQSVKKLKAEDAKRRPKFKVALSRLGNFKGEVQLKISGLPENVSVHNTTIAAGASSAELVFIALASTKISSSELIIEGTAMLDGKSITRAATAVDGTSSLRIGVVPAVPFKHRGVYRIITGLPGGTTYHRKYSIDRGDFTGPITVRLADKQIRHLQGVRDHIVTVPEGTDDFAFPVKFPARIEVGRTSRVCVMLIGEMTDFDGSKHKISYTSRERDDQLISVAAEGLVTVQTSSNSFTARPNSEIVIPVTIRREPAVRTQPMRVELLLPGHINDIFAEPALLRPNESKVLLKVKIGDSPGPWNAPLLIRAMTTSAPRHLAEKKVEFVAPLR